MDRFTDDVNIHQGHRERMRAKLFSYGQRIFDSYELLEMLLYHTVPLRDTNPVAKRLLLAFDGLDGVLKASREELLSVNGIGERTADFLTKVDYLRHVIGAEMLSDGDDRAVDYDSVGKCLVKHFDGKENNEVVGIFLDSGMRVISVKKLFDLDFESGGVKPKAFIDEAVNCNATVVISAHNHPYGPFYPTQGDRATHCLITDSLNSAGFVHAEHYIISGECYAGMGSLKNFNVRLAQMPAVDRFLESAEVKGCVAKKVSAIPGIVSFYPSGTERGGKNIYDLSYFADLLSYVLPSKANDTADMLLSKYSTIEKVFSASARDLISLVGEPCAFYLKILAYITSRREMDKFAFGKPCTSAQVANYLKALFIGESVEVTYIITYNKFGAVTGCHFLGEGTVSSSEVLPRKAVEVAIGAKAVSVAMAHNHPGGNAVASTDDINMTRFFAGIFKSCDIVMRDHFIIAGQLCDTVEFDIETD